MMWVGILSMAVLFSAYVGIYCYYRIWNERAVLDYVGNVIRPPFLQTKHETKDFSFSKYSTAYGPFGFGALGESFATESMVSRLSVQTGYDCAGPANTLFYPAMRIDHLFNGKYIRFTNAISGPIFATRKLKTQVLIQP